MSSFAALSRNLPIVIRENTKIFNEDSRSPCRDLKLRSPECEALGRDVRNCASSSHLKYHTKFFRYST
jgi:hypothetical protein